MNRQEWEDVADRLLDAAWRWATPGGALLNLPGRPSRSGVRSDGLEGYARTFLAAAFRVAGAGGADPHGWLYLRGTPAETRRLLDAYGGVARPGRMLAHSDWIFLVDGENRVREIYSERLFNPERALADIASLTATARPR